MTTTQTTQAPTVARIFYVSTEHNTESQCFSVWTETEGLDAAETLAYWWDNQSETDFDPGTVVRLTLESEDSGPFDTAEMTLPGESQSPAPTADDVRMSLLAHETGSRSIHVTPYTHYAYIEMTELVRSDCEGCGQPLSTDGSGPVDIVDTLTGDVVGGYSHQHGCGSWNTPLSVSDRLDLEVDDAYSAADAIASRLVAILDDLVADQRTAIRAEVTAQVAADHLSSLAPAAEGYDYDADTDNILSGSETEPGSYIDGADLITWAYVPVVDSDEYVEQRTTIAEGQS